MNEITELLIHNEEQLQKEFDENREEHARLLEEMEEVWCFGKIRLTRELNENRRRFARLYNDLRIIKVNLHNQR